MFSGRWTAQLAPEGVGDFSSLGGWRSQGAVVVEKFSGARIAQKSSISCVHDSRVRQSA